jgi:hypothetical protein
MCFVFSLRQELPFFPREEEESESAILAKVDIVFREEVPDYFSKEKS